MTELTNGEMTHTHYSWQHSNSVETNIDLDKEIIENIGLKV